MFEIIGYWVVTSVLILPVWLGLLLFLYFHLDNVYYNTEYMYKHLPFYHKLDDFFNHSLGIDLTSYLLFIISLLFTFFSGLLGVKSGTGITEGVLISSHIVSKVLAPFASFVVYILLAILGMRFAVKLTAKFVIMSNKIEKLNREE